MMHFYAHRTKWATPLFLLIFTSFIAGCWVPRKEGETLKQQIEEVRQEQVRAKTNAEEQQKNLEQLIKKATGLLSKNNADVGSQVEALQLSIGKSEGRHEEHSHNIAELKLQIVAITERLEKLEGNNQEKMPPKTTAGEDINTMSESQLILEAQASLTNKQYLNARKTLRFYVSKFSSKPQAALAQRMIGDSYYREKKFAPAIQEYRKVIEGYKKSSEVPNALYMIGLSFYDLGFCTDSTLFLQNLRRKYKRHSNTKKAKRLLRKIRKNKKNRKVCRS